MDVELARSTWGFGATTAGTAELALISGRSDFQERLIGSIRRECLDHVIVFREAYGPYYNRLRTHLSLDKDAPGFRRVHRSVASRRCRSWAPCIIGTFGFEF